MDSVPRNRKERRRRGADSGRPSQSHDKHDSARIHDDDSTPPIIPLAHPRRDQAQVPNGKTLYDLADERESLLRQGEPFSPTAPLASSERNKPRSVEDEIEELSRVQRHDDQNDGEEEDEMDEEEAAWFDRIGQSLFFAVSLAMLHCTLDVLVHHQYRQEIGWSMIFTRVGVAFPIMLGLIYALHTGPPTPSTVTTVRQLFFLALSVGSGCYLVHAANEDPYWAVMKRAPPLGTLWIWSVIELKLQYALASLIVVGGFLWFGGYNYV